MTTKNLPTIGIVVRAIVIPGRRDPIQGVFSSYIDCIHASGGLPLLVPFVSDAAINQLDGLVLSGGEDLAQSSYWSAGGPRAPLDAERDMIERSIILSAREKKVPVLGICRGAQVVNCSLGGTVARFADCDLSKHTSSAGCVCTHIVKVVSGAEFVTLFGGEETSSVVSRHSCFISKLGRGLRVAAVADDGTVEAFDSTEWACLGIQWHPEWRGPSAQRDLRPFEWLISQASGRMKA